MQSENRIVDDLVKFVNGMAGTVAGMGREAEASFKERTREFVGGMDFVSREEFDAVKAMASKAREEVETLKARLDAMDAGAAHDDTASDQSRSDGPHSDGPQSDRPQPAAPLKGGSAAPGSAHTAEPKKDGPGAL